MLHCSSHKLGVCSLFTVELGGSLVAKSCPTPGSPRAVARQALPTMDFPGKTLEWVAISSSRGIFLTQGLSLGNVSPLHWQGILSR